MTNKEKLQEEIEKDISTQKYYNEIINKIEKKEKRKKCFWKLSLIPFCFVVVVTSVLFLNYNDNKNYVDKDEDKDNIILNINEINGKMMNMDDIGGFAIDLTLEELKSEEKLISKFEIVPSLNESRLMKRYDIDSKFIGYNLIYNTVDKNMQINKEIEIFLSKSLKHKPNCFQLMNFDELENSVINNTNVKILKEEKENNYHVLFTYNDYNFDIKALNITEEELLTLLLSILK